MRKTIFSVQDFARNSNLSTSNYEIRGNRISFHPHGHSKGAYEAVITFTHNGAIGNYFGSKYSNVFSAIESIGINPKTIWWINDRQ